MQHKLINTGDYLLIVDDSEIKEGDWVYCWETINGTPSNFDIVLMTSKNYTHWVNGADNYKKVISHLPLNNSPILEGVDLLPPLEDDNMHFGDLRNVDVDSFMSGYNKAKEKCKYTEEDMKKAMLKYGEWIMSNLSSKEYIKDSNNQTVYEHIIQSLQQPKMPVGFECEMITMNKGYTKESDYPYQQCDIPKTTINSQGLTQWVGEYIY